MAPVVLAGEYPEYEIVPVEGPSAAEEHHLSLLSCQLVVVSVPEWPSVPVEHNQGFEVVNEPVSAVASKIVSSHPSPL